MSMKFTKSMMLLISVLISVVFTSCKDESDEPLDPSEDGRLILIYAVAANNLQYNLTADMSEILQVAPKLDLVNNAVLVYYVRQDGLCKLARLTKTQEGKYDFLEETTFPDEPLSTTSERMREVFSYVETNYNYSNKGLIMWSHGTGWLYWPDGSGPGSKYKAFGEDKYEGKTYKTNIPELAEGIPAGMFDFIWFDLCYAANIETIYQLRDKTPYIIGSVIEISANGMPYDITMPYLLNADANIMGAAGAFSDYYARYDTPYAMSILRTDRLPELADISREIIAIGQAPADFRNIQNYSILFENGKRTTFYDLEQLLDGYGDVPTTLKQKLADCMSRLVIFNRISDFNWSNRYVTTNEMIDVEDCSGVSMNHFVDNGSESSEYYKTLDWYKAIY